MGAIQYHIWQYNSLNIINLKSKRLIPKYCDCWKGISTVRNIKMPAILVEWFDNSNTAVYHDDVIKWKHFPRYWPFVRGIHRSPVNCPHKGQWRGALMFSLICARINGWVNNREAGNLRCHRPHYDVIVMWIGNVVVCYEVYQILNCSAAIVYVHVLLTL